jgi:release factor glutamine methyltransferase
VTIEQAFRSAREAMSHHSIDDAAIESEVLLRCALGISKVQLYLDFNRDISPDDIEKFHCLVERRIAGEPTAYITGHREFYGLDFFVDRRVLIPRPESEHLVEAALKLAQQGARSFADIGTGTGAIAVCIAVNAPQTKIYASDISRDALDVALLNCRRHGVEGRVELLQGNLAGPLPLPVDVILANLPYVRRADLAAVNTLGYEPVLALDGGADGLEHIKNLVEQATRKLNKGGSLLLEIGQGQTKSVIDFLGVHFPTRKTGLITDYSGIPRVVVLS